MRIARDDTEHMITVDFAWLMAFGFATLWSVAAIHLMMDRGSRWNIVFGVGMIIVGVIGANQCATRIEFDFDKSARELTWTSSSLTRKRRKVIPFAEIQGAGIHVYHRNNNRLYRIELRTANGMLPLSNAYSTVSKEELESVAERINFITRG